MVDREKAARLRHARERAGFRSAARAAEALGMPYATYAGQENGTRGFGREYVERYAERLGIDPAWLEFGTPEAAPAPIAPVEPTEVIERLEREREEALVRADRAFEATMQAEAQATQARSDHAAALREAAMLAVAIGRLRPRDEAA